MPVAVLHRSPGIQLGIAIGAALVARNFAAEQLANYDASLADGPPPWITDDAHLLRMWEWAHRPEVRARAVVSLERCRVKLAELEAERRG